MHLICGSFMLHLPPIAHVQNLAHTHTHLLVTRYLHVCCLRSANNKNAAAFKRFQADSPELRKQSIIWALQTNTIGRKLYSAAQVSRACPKRLLLCNCLCVHYSAKKHHNGHLCNNDTWKCDACPASALKTLSFRQTQISCANCRCTPHSRAKRWAWSVFWGTPWSVTFCPITFCSLVLTGHE